MTRYFKIILCFTIFLLVSSCSETIEERNSQNDNQTGRYTEYYNNKQIKKVEGNLIEGKKYGTWLTYDSLGLVTHAGYYYKDDLFKVLDNEDFNLDTIKIDSNFVVAIPNNWILTLDYKGALAIVVKKREIKEEFSPSINFVKVEGVNSSDFKSFVEKDLYEIQKHTPGTKVKEKKYEKSYEVDYCQLLYFIKSGDKKIGVRSSYLNIKSSIYIITCIAEAEDEKFIEYKDLFQLVIENSIALSTK